jgi:hypothetical protein
MWVHRRLTTLWASTACYRDSFTFKKEMRWAGESLYFTTYLYSLVTGRVFRPCFWSGAVVAASCRREDGPVTIHTHPSGPIPGNELNRTHCAFRWEWTGLKSKEDYVLNVSCCHGNSAHYRKRDIMVSAGNNISFSRRRADFPFQNSDTQRGQLNLH